MHVQELRRKILSDDYEVDPGAVAEAIVDRLEVQRQRLRQRQEVEDPEARSAEVVEPH